MKQMNNEIEPITVSVLGTGNMGSALARTFLSGRINLTVWNRTARKAQSLADDVARHHVAGQNTITVAGSVAEAVRASDVVVVCLLDYAASEQALHAVGVAELLAGKTVVQLTTGGTEETKREAQWVSQHGAKYLDGVIMGMASDVGKDEMMYLFSGSQSAYKHIEPLLTALRGKSVILGNKPGMASGFYIASNSWYCAMLFTFLHGAALCDSEEIDLDFYTQVSVAALERIVPPLMKDMTEKVLRDEYPGDDGNLQVYESVVDLIVRMCDDNGVRRGAMGEILSLMREGVAAGYGQNDLSVLFKLLRHKDTH